MSDRGPAPVLRPHEDPRFDLYIDNAGVVGLEKEVVTERLQKGGEQLDGAGLTTHEVEITNTGADMLGWRLDCKRKETRITPKRYHSLRKALGWVLRLPRIAGWMLEAIVGHTTFAALCRRPVLSALHIVYRFINAH